jgi:hypothetical protein
LQKQGQQSLIQMAQLLLSEKMQERPQQPPPLQAQALVLRARHHRQLLLLQRWKGWRRHPLPLPPLADLHGKQEGEVPQR